MFVWHEAVFPGNRRNQQLELMRMEVDELAAACAVQVVVMRLEGASEFIALFPAHRDNFGYAKLNE